MVNIVRKKLPGEFGLSRKPFGYEIVADPPEGKFPQSDPPPPGHPLEACVGQSEGNPKLVGQFSLGEIRGFLQFFEKRKVPYSLRGLKQGIEIVSHTLTEL